jgi:hypothetical protein
MAMISYGQRLLNERDFYAERNGKLHVLCHEMLTALEELGHERVHEWREVLHRVPQLDPEHPMRRGY